MTIARQDVERIAQLARLALSEAEIDRMASDLGSILEHMDELVEVDTTGVPPLGGIGDAPAPMRADEPGADPLHLAPEELAPAWEERFFLVPRLAALDSEALAEQDEAS
jgi:aspartyl-tRNA(Asn)/glutamyl-tRNA(Gln) amidotransferase subunit C